MKRSRFVNGYQSETALPGRKEGVADTSFTVAPGLRFPQDSNNLFHRESTLFHFLLCFPFKAELRFRHVQFFGVRPQRACAVSSEIARLPSNVFSAWLTRDIAGMVAAMTEGDPGVESERTSRNILG